MKKIALSLFVIAVFVFYAFNQKFRGSDEVNVIAPKSISGNQPPSSSVADTTSQTGQFKDGTYTGDVTDAYYGNVQVKTVINGGKITDVQFLQYPSDRGTSVQINTQAMPYLKQEAIAAQSDSVDIVSGATQTSLAFRTSLKSALAQAKN